MTTIITALEMGCENFFFDESAIMDLSPTPRSNVQYTRRLNHVLDFIHAHLDQTLTLEVLAAEAGFSAFHFHRLFKSLVGETLNQYIWRARLERAANMLAYHPETTLLEISLACGFSSPAVFSRAFRERFDMSPSQYRKQSKAQRKQGKELGEGDGYNGKHRLPIHIPRSDVPMKVDVKTLPTYHVAFVRHISGYSKGQFSLAINQAFQQVCGWAAARDLTGPQTRVIGIPYDNPDVTPNDRCRYDACVTVPDTVKDGSGEIGIQDIPGGKYAVCRIEVPAAEAHKIGETVDQMYGQWLPSSGFTVEDKPALEIYYEDPNRPQGTWVIMEYCIPVKPL